jgi:hypothetical protein
MFRSAHGGQNNCDVADAKVLRQPQVAANGNTKGFYCLTQR